MREFFKGWRRKVGCIALVLATAAATIWCRSVTVRDQLDLVRNDGLDPVSGMTMRQLTSVSGILSWETIHHFEDFLDSAIPESGWSSQPAKESDRNGYGGLCQWRFGWGGFEIAEGTFGRARVWRWAFPYWLIAVPLTLASAYLILWKPRRKPA